MMQNASNAYMNATPYGTYAQTAGTHAGLTGNTAGGMQHHLGMGATNFSGPPLNFEQQFLAGYHALGRNGGHVTTGDYNQSGNAQAQLAALQGNGLGMTNSAAAGAAGLTGTAATTKEEPKTLLGKIKKNFWEVQTWAFLPSMLLLPLGWMKATQNIHMTDDPSIPKHANVGTTNGLKGWRKPLHHVASGINKYDSFVWRMGKGVSNFVKNSLGLKLPKNSWFNKLWNGKIWKWEYAKGTKGLRPFLLSMFGGAGNSTFRNAATRTVGNKLMANFSLRSILTGFGIAGPLGWISLAAGIGLTAFNYFRKKKTGSGNEMNAQQQALLEQQLQQGQFQQGQLGQTANTNGLDANSYNALLSNPYATNTQTSTDPNAYFNTISGINNSATAGSSLGFNTNFNGLQQQGQSQVSNPLAGMDISSFSPQSQQVLFESQRLLQAAQMENTTAAYGNNTTGTTGNPFASSTNTLAYGGGGNGLTNTAGGWNTTPTNIGATWNTPSLPNYSTLGQYGYPTTS